jgi:ribosome-associated translation inhibitor RaiA
MIRVVFKNVIKSDLAREAVRQRLSSVIAKFPDLRLCLIQVTVEMKNSPLQPGPDFFSIACHVHRGRYQGLRIEKSASNLYAALHELVVHLGYKLNTSADRIRVKERTKARRLLSGVLYPASGD